MLYQLVYFSDQISALNVFRYISFRTGGAIFTRDHRPAAR